MTQLQYFTEAGDVYLLNRCNLLTQWTGWLELSEGSGDGFGDAVFVCGEDGWGCGTETDRWRDDGSWNHSRYQSRSTVRRVVGMPHHQRLVMKLVLCSRGHY